MLPVIWSISMPAVNRFARIVECGEEKLTPEAQRY
jgi:hypothetical protein